MLLPVSILFSVHSSKSGLFLLKALPEQILRMPKRQMQPHGAERHIEENAEVLLSARDR